MGMYVVRQIGLACLCLILFFSCTGKPIPGIDPVAKGDDERMVDASILENWKFMYFYGISKINPRELNLSQDHLKALFSMTNVRSALSTGSAIDPRFILNSKGFTVWLSMLTTTYLNDSGALATLEKRGGYLYWPGNLNDIFKEETHWPKEVFMNYDLKLGNYRLFVIPFLVPQGMRGITALPYSLKSNDGSNEIYNIQEFDENAPEKLLEEFDQMIKFIEKNRPDILNG